uniref:Ras GTPase-activating protein 3 n=1 Tax=Cacopsylla melanoneura TaxID=428564 RepID=A0A8D8YL03_9HEMI
MHDEDSNDSSEPTLRTEERIKIKIGEAKNLPSRTQGSSTPRDVYSVVSLDQEPIFKTCTIERTLNPFFGEEFQFDIPRRFRHLAIYTYDKDRTNKQDKVLGKVTIKRDELYRLSNKEHWFPLFPVTQDSEVQGKIHIDVHSSESSLFVHVTEASSLTQINGQCDATALVTVYYTNGRSDVQKSKVKKKTNSPMFKETFIFDGTLGDWIELVVSLHHDISGLNVFLGEVRIPLNNRDTLSSLWYYLQPRKRLTALNHINQDIGTLRIRIQYTADHILQAHYYDELCSHILNSPSVQPVTSSVVYLLGKVEAIQPLVRLLVFHNRIVPMMRSLAELEMSKVTNTNTIFRGNSLVSKMMDETMKLTGLHYLHETLRAPLEKIFAERKNCEIDPSRMKDKSHLAGHRVNLKYYIEDIVKCITSSVSHTPPLMCSLFHELRGAAARRFPDNQDVQYSVVSGFVFLRFFAPAILGPRLFGLTSQQIDEQTSRTLTLISKAIQSVCNVVSSKTPPQKEEYMHCVYEVQHVIALKQFLELISASPHPLQQSLDTPVIVKESFMKKRAQGRKPFGRRNFKRRYFRLTSSGLLYAKDKSKDPLCVIPIADILSVQRVTYESFYRSNMFQVIQPHRILYVQANNCVEENEWIHILTQMCLNQIDKYHPSAYIDSVWLCCNSTDKNLQGCTQVGGTTNDIDPTWELARIQSLAVTYMDRLNNVMHSRL